MSGDVSVGNEPKSAAWIGWLLGLVACLILFGPLVAVSSYYARTEHLSANTAAETVGIGVILRAMFRRLLRSGARSVMQTTLGTVTRASSRTMTRRVVRVGVKSVTTLFWRSTRTTVVERDVAAVDANSRPQSTWWGLGLGFVALALSLAGVLLVLDLDQPATDEGPYMSAVLGGMPLWMAMLLGALPLLVYAALLFAAARRFGVELRFYTGWEALLLQAYFTGSGSFLPLSTDSEIDGPQSARTRMALTGLVGLLILHLICVVASRYFDSYALQYAGGMFLLYCFVFSFPIAPLDGYHLWTSSRWLWLVTWIPILALFILTMPETLHVIL